MQAADPSAQNDAEFQFGDGQSDKGARGIRSREDSLRSDSRGRYDCRRSLIRAELIRLALSSDELQLVIIRRNFVILSTRRISWCHPNLMSHRSAPREIALGADLWTPRA